MKEAAVKGEREGQGREGMGWEGMRVKVSAAILGK